MTEVSVGQSPRNKLAASNSVITETLTEFCFIPIPLVSLQLVNLLTNKNIYYVTRKSRALTRWQIHVQHHLQKDVVITNVQNQWVDHNNCLYGDFLCCTVLSCTGPNTAHHIKNCCRPRAQSCSGWQTQKDSLNLGQSQSSFLNQINCNVCMTASLTLRCILNMIEHY